MVGDMSAGSQGALIGVSAGVIGLWLYAMIASRWQLAHDNYNADCLIQKGFKREEVYDD